MYLFEVEFGFADLHPRALGSLQGFRCRVNIQAQLQNGGLHAADLHHRCIVRMTSRTNANAFRAEHAVVSLSDFVVFVTDNASGKSQVLEWLGVRTLTEKIFFLTVTLAAYACDRIHARWARPMVAMTVVATGCSKVMPVEQRGCMNALPVLVKLIRWNLVCRHPLRIRVAFGAG